MVEGISNAVICISLLNNKPSCSTRYATMLLIVYHPNPGGGESGQGIRHIVAHCCVGKPNFAARRARMTISSGSRALRALEAALSLPLDDEEPFFVFLLADASPP